MPYLYIQSFDQLAEFCAQCEICPWLAIDTEFIRQDTYFPKLSLIQIETHDQQAAIIDPIAVEDLSPLWQLLSNPQVCKVFHSARQDIEVLYFASDQIPKNLFDTQIAAVFLGYGDLAGFAKVVSGELDITLDKDQTRTNWHQRPLTEQQLNYAYEDVHYLAPLYQTIRQKLTPEQYSLLQEDFAALLNPQLYLPNPALAGLKLKSAKNLTQKQQAIAYKLAEWREKHAIAIDQPRKWSLSDDVLISIAKHPPKTQDGFYRIPHVKSSNVKAFGAKWIRLIAETLAHPENWPEKEPRQNLSLNPQEQIIFLWLQSYTQQIALDTCTNPAGILTKTELAQIIKGIHPKTLTGWKHLLIETPLQQLLSGSVNLSILENRIHLS